MRSNRRVDMDMRLALNWYILMESAKMGDLIRVEYEALQNWSNFEIVVAGEFFVGIAVHWCVIYLVWRGGRAPAPMQQKKVVNFNQGVPTARDLLFSWNFLPDLV